MERRLMLCAGFGENQRAVLEIERKEANLSGDLASPVPPPESTRDHEMEDEKQLALGLEHNPLAQTVEVDDDAAIDRRQWRFDRSEQKRCGESVAGDAASDNSRAKRMQVEQYVG